MKNQREQEREREEQICEERQVEVEMRRSELERGR